MKRIGMGLVGAGFVGPHHIDAVRRLGFVDIVAVAGSNDASGQARRPKRSARARATAAIRRLIDDPDVQVVHNATPNYLHYEVTSAALAKGKHVVSDKPLAMTAAQSKRLVDEARRAGVVTAVTFNYRGNPLVQHARQAIARGDIGTPQFPARPLHPGLAAQRDRLLVAPRPGEGRRLLGARRHRLALVRPGAAHERADDHTRARRHHHGAPEARKKPRGSREAFQAAGERRRPTSSTSRSRISRRCSCGSTTARRGRSRSARSVPATRTISSSRCADRRRR